MPVDATLSDIPGIELSASVKLTGQFDGLSAENFTRFWHRLVEVENRRWFMVDLDGIESMVEPAMRTLMTFAEAVRRLGGELVIIQPSHAVQMMMLETASGDHFPIVSEYREAFDHLRKARARGKRREQSGGQPGRVSLPLRESASGPPAAADAIDTGLQFDVDLPADGSQVAHTRVVPAPPAGDGPATATPPGGTGHGGTGFRMRAYNETGEQHVVTVGADGKPALPPTQVLLMIPVANEALEKLLEPRLKDAGITVKKLFPIDADQGIDHVEAMVSQADIVLADFSPARVRVPDPNADVVTALTIARYRLGPERLLILHSVLKLPVLWHDVASEPYSDSAGRIKQVVPRAMEKLNRLRRTLPPR